MQNDCFININELQRIHQKCCVLNINFEHRCVYIMYYHSDYYYFSNSICLVMNATRTFLARQKPMQLLKMHTI